MVKTYWISDSRTQVHSILLAVQGSWPFSSQHCKQLPSAEKSLCEQTFNSTDTSVRWRWCRAYCLKTKSFWLYDASLWWQSIVLLWLCPMSLKIPFNQIIKSWWGDRVSEAGSWSVNSAERINTLVSFLLSSSFSCTYSWEKSVPFLTAAVF